MFDVDHRSLMSTSDVDHRCGLSMLIIDIDHRCGSSMSTIDVDHRCRLSMVTVAGSGFLFLISPISHFSFPISHFSFPISHFLFLVSTFDSGVTSYFHFRFRRCLASHLSFLACRFSLLYDLGTGARCSTFFDLPVGRNQSGFST